MPKQITPDRPPDQLPPPPSGPLVPDRRAGPGLAWWAWWAAAGPPVPTCDASGRVVRIDRPLTMIGYVLGPA